MGTAHAAARVSRRLREAAGRSSYFASPERGANKVGRGQAVKEGGASGATTRAHGSFIFRAVEALHSPSGMWWLACEREQQRVYIVSPTIKKHINYLKSVMN